MELGGSDCNTVSAVSARGAIVWVCGRDDFGQDVDVAQKRCMSDECAES